MIIECPVCDSFFNAETTTHVQDSATGTRYCGAMCHHEMQFGIRVPLTMAEDANLERAREWARRNAA